MKLVHATNKEHRCTLMPFGQPILKVKCTLQVRARRDVSFTTWNVCDKIKILSWLCCYIISGWILLNHQGIFVLKKWQLSGCCLFLQQEKFLLTSCWDKANGYSRLIRIVTGGTTRVIISILAIRLHSVFLSCPPFVSSGGWFYLLFTKDISQL